MSKKIRAQLGLRTLILGFVITIFSLSAFFVFRALAQYSNNLDRFSFYSANNDKDGTANELVNLKNNYLEFSRWHLKYFADTYLFKDMFLYEARTAFLNEDYEGSLEWLKGHEDDPRAFYMSGIAKFRVLKAAYHSDAASKNEEIKNEIINKVMDDVRSDFEAAVKKGPGPTKAFNYSFDYDLSSDKKSAKQAMESLPQQPKFILGMKKAQPGKDGKLPGKKDKSERRVDDPTAGQNDARKKG